MTLFFRFSEKGDGTVGETVRKQPDGLKWLQGGLDWIEMEKMRDFSAPGHLDNMAFPTDTVLRLACAVALTEQRRRREVKDAFEEFSEEEFRQCFRLSKRTVRSLCDELDPIIGCQRASGLSTERKVLCALRFFATGSFQKSIGREEHIGMSQPAVSNTIHEVTEAIITVAARKRVADFLLTTAAKDEAKVEFVLRGCIPGVLACADGTLVTIRKPEGFRLADTASFMSRRGYYVLNVMIVSTVRIVYYSPFGAIVQL